METFELNYSLEELKKRTDKEYLITKKFLDVDAPEYLALDEGDKKALKNLVKAAYFIQKINAQLDNKKNIAFYEYLHEEILKGNERAELTKILFLAQIGICGIDRESTKISLAKGIEELPGKGLYPEDLSKEEFHKILIKMLKENKIEEVRKILNQRSVVLRQNDELVAKDYVDYFSEEFRVVAEKLEAAAQTSTNKAFNEYLRLQAIALRISDPMLDAYADKKWAELQDTPLEFTITRENYADEMTGSVVENEELKKLLDDNNIQALPKDFLGGRVGIVNKEGTEALLKIKDFLPDLAANMPYNDEYEQNISQNSDVKQTMVDVDIVVLAGDVGAYRAGITLAENLPNDDKLSLTIGGGRRNVYHRQIRFISDREKLQKRLDAVLDKEQHQYYLDEADHWFTIGHENTHSLGPNKGTEALGKYKSIIEENKADMGALAFLDILEEKGMYTHEQVLQILVSFAADNFLKSKPTLSQAHRVRSVMQNKYFIENGAIELTTEGKIHVNIDKMIPTAKKMLAEIVRIQIDGDFAKGEKYVLDNFIWTEEMETISQKLKEIDKSLNGRTDAPLARMLLKS
ncbi:hypothetical protein DBY21_08935 [Candidatus Gastranaerophilales bacterium]|nr:MAG: hypothetical protein DBY21_08935 [Candidatus Gastranaerophilales bacterium]